MNSFLIEEKCTGCAACANTCPKQCIQMLADQEGFLRPVIDETQCVSCGSCQNVCPVLHPAQCGHETVAYAAICKDEDIRKESTSGGVFSLLCQWIFDHGGVVFGAAFADDFSVEHLCIQSMDDFSALRTAKYAQSRVGDSFQQVKRLLDEGRYVLFSGTHCQIGGLQAFLGKEYEKLILVDLVCHGVPSPSVWLRYVDYRNLSDAPDSTPESINLRSKETGWPSYSVCFHYRNGTRYSAKSSEDPFMRCFVGNLCLRPSCYVCQFKGITRVSDFTLGDYWGVWSQLPEFNDGKGTSIVLIHSKKGRNIWSEIGKKMQMQQVDAAHCMDENPSAIQSSPMPPTRSTFMLRYSNEDFAALVKELLPPPAPVQKSSLLRRVIRKFRH